MEGHHQILVVKYTKEPDIILNIENVSTSKYPGMCCVNAMEKGGVGEELQNCSKHNSPNHQPAHSFSASAPV